jgi:DNA-binding HxlR family transcriptional regulator
MILLLKMEGIKEEIVNHDTPKSELFKTIKEIGNLLGKRCTVEILQYLSSHDPMRYKELKKSLNCDDKMLSRRLKKLKNHDIIKQLSITPGKREIHEYTLTEKGEELIKFFKIFVQDEGEK